MLMMRWIRWSLFTLVLAALIHWLAISEAPSLIMWRAMGKLVHGRVNTISHMDRATQASRTVVKPSPDLLYSSCAFDVSRHPLKIVTGAPSDTYWSVSLYADNTDNFFALNDTQAQGQPATIILLGPGQSAPIDTAGTITVNAPSTRGLVLFRTLINDDRRQFDIDKARRAATCQPLS
jgi:uncharacterized membrane protein